MDFRKVNIVNITLNFQINQREEYKNTRYNLNKRYITLAIVYVYKNTVQRYRCVLTIDSKSKQFIFDEEGVAIITPN